LPPLPGGSGRPSAAPPLPQERPLRLERRRLQARLLRRELLPLREPLLPQA